MNINQPRKFVVNQPQLIHFHSQPITPSQFPDSSTDRRDETIWNETKRINKWHQSGIIHLPSCPSQHNHDASRRPIFPKHTQLQNNTLAIHVATATSPCDIPIAIIPSSEARPEPLLNDEAALEEEEGSACCAETISGLISSRAIMPVMPIRLDRTKPDLDRSMRYHRKGLTRARVRETWRVDCQGVFRWRRKMVSD